MRAGCVFNMLQTLDLPRQRGSWLTRTVLVPAGPETFSGLTQDLRHGLFCVALSGLGFGWASLAVSARALRSSARAALECLDAALVTHANSRSLGFARDDNSLVG